jgi:cell division protein FtsA
LEQKVAKERIVVGIDVGSSKIANVVASLTPEGKLTVIGVATVASKGIRKGQVVDIDEAVSAMSECLEQTERMAGVSINSAFVSVGGSHISSVNSRGVVAVAGGENEISEDDVQRVVEAARAISIPSSREIIHVIPRDFVVDSQEGIKDPVGMTGVRLEVETHIISGATTSIRNLVKCVQQIGIDVGKRN